MKNLSVPEPKVKSVPIVVEEVVTELDPSAVKELISDYNSLTEKCKKLYELKFNKHIGDLYISLDTLKTIVNKL